MTKMSKIEGGFKMMTGIFYTPGYFDWFCNLRFQNRYAYQYYGVDREKHGLL